MLGLLELMALCFVIFGWGAGSVINRAAAVGAHVQARKITGDKPSNLKLEIDMCNGIHRLQPRMPPPRDENGKELTIETMLKEVPKNDLIYIFGHNYLQTIGRPLSFYASRTASLAGQFNDIHDIKINVWLSERGYKGHNHTTYYAIKHNYLINVDDDTVLRALRVIERNIRRFHPNERLGFISSNERLEWYSSATQASATFIPADWSSLIRSEREDYYCNE